MRTGVRPVPQAYGYEAQFVPPQIIDEPLPLPPQEEEEVSMKREKKSVQRSAPPPMRSPSPDEEEPVMRREKKAVQRCKC